VAKETHVIFLDDEESILDGIQRLFIKEPYGVFTTANVEKARQALRQQHVKVVVSDQRMPEIQGVDFLQEVKVYDSRIVRILFTGYTDFVAAKEAINLGDVYKFINKPWKTAELLAAIRQAIEYYDDNHGEYN
jgi:DNA-binding NtrC family response regulator